MANALEKWIINRLNTFTNFLALPNSAGQFSVGLVGEMGWPSNADTASWNAVADYYLHVLDQNGIHNTTYVAGRWWSNSYNLTQYGNGATDINTAYANTPPSLAHPTSPTYLRGMNLGGAEFGAEGNSAFSNTNLGVVNTNYVWPTLADFQYLAAHNVSLVRFCARWERLQPTPGAALDTTYLAGITTALQNAQAVGIKFLLDFHNYGRYQYQNGGSVIALVLDTSTSGINTTLDANGEGRIGQNLFQDFWGRISDALKTGYPALWAYDLMNEPHDLPVTAGGHQPYQNWENITFQTVNYLRQTKNDTTTIVVPGYSWNLASWQHTNKWIVEPTTLGNGSTNTGTHIYECHHYWDTTDSGGYSANYATSYSNATSAGYADDADTTPPSISGAAVRLS